jgi:hypothetical protein
MDNERQSAIDCLVNALQSDVDSDDFKLTLDEALESRKRRGTWDFLAWCNFSDEAFKGPDALLAENILLRAEELAEEIARARKVVAEGEALKVSS